MRTPPTPSKLRSRAGSGHQGRLASAWSESGLRKLGEVTVLAHETDDEFLLKAEPHRRELLAHCYRMTGSLHDAEDLVQETYLRAWKAYGGFKGQSSLRTWLYRIATNTCLTALDSRQRRPLPTGLGQPSSDPDRDIDERDEVPWLEPLPDRFDDPSDPSTIVGSRESVRLAFVAALQHLSPRQRAVLVLRDVLQWKAAEVAEAIGTSTAAVNSLLQRARAQLDAVGPSEDDELADRIRRRRKDLLDALHRGVRDTTTSTSWSSCSPTTRSGRCRRSTAGIRARRTSSRCPRRTARPKAAGDMRFIRTTANGQPAAALYMLNRETGVHEAFQLHVLDVTPGRHLARRGVPHDVCSRSSACPRRSRPSSGHLCHAIDQNPC